MQDIVQVDQGAAIAAIISAVFVFILIGAALVFWPTIRILKRLGLSPWMSLLLIVPIGNLLLLWIVAYSDWGNVKTTSRA